MNNKSSTYVSTNWKHQEMLHSCYFTRMQQNTFSDFCLRYSSVRQHYTSDYHKAGHCSVLESKPSCHNISNGQLLMCVCLFLCRSQWLPSMWPVPSPVQRLAVWQVQCRLLQSIWGLCSMWLQWEWRPSGPHPAVSPRHRPLPPLHQQHHWAPVPALCSRLHRGRQST